MNKLPEFLSLSRDNRTLTFHPFSSSQYSSSIHATEYKCLAKNEAGIVSSPDIDLRAGKMTDLYSLTQLFSIQYCRNIPRLTK